MEHGEAVEVVSEIGQGGFKATSSLTDAAEAVAAELGDAPEGVFNAGPNAALLLVLAHLGPRQWISRVALFADVGEHVEALQDRPDGRADVGAVGPQHRVAVAFAQQFLDRLRVVHGGVRHGKSLDKLAGRIDLHVVLVTVIRLAVLLCPAGVEVFLALASRLFSNALGHLAALDLRVLVTAIALLRSLNKTGVDDLAAAGDQPLVA